MRFLLQSCKGMLVVSAFTAAMLTFDAALAVDKIVALYSAHAVPYSMPWVAEELGL